MTTIASLPTIKVYVAFNPLLGSNTLATANSVAFTQQYGGVNYWTDCSAYLRDFSTKMGKQHYLDRVESSTIQLTLNNRDGFFTNGTVNGTTYTIAPRLPIAIQATWNSNPYPVFFGLVESITEKLADALNSDLVVHASDLLKYMSLKYLYRPSFWKLFAGSAQSAQNWYRCSNYSIATVTSATANSSASTVTYQIVNANTTFAVGQNVTVSGLAGPSQLNVQNKTITAATSTSFTVSLATTGNPTSTSAGVAYLTLMYDYIGGNNGRFIGQVSYPAHGVLVYDADGCVDLSGQGNVASAAITIPTPSQNSGNYGSIDFWILGQQVQSNFLFTTNYGGLAANTISLKISSTGILQCYVGATLSANATQVNDGYWHHVGLLVDNSGSVWLYCDGVFYGVSGITASYFTVSPTVPTIVGGSSVTNFGYNGMVDEIVISNISHQSTLASEVQQRFTAGQILQQGFPVTSNKVYSADRIAEVLVLAGFGSVNTGSLTTKATLNVPNFYIANGYRNVYAYNSASFKGTAAVEPYYWDSPIDTSTALDLIQQVTETDIGSFYQDGSGTFFYLPQNYYGTWSFTNAVPPSTPSGTWALNTASIGTGIATFTDADSTYPYSPATNGYAYEANGLEVVQDDVDVWTTVRITPQSGVDQIYENTAQEARYGFSTLTKSSTVNSSLADALSTAYYLGYIYASPLPRVNAVALWSETANGANLPIQLGASFGDAVTFKRTQPNAAGAGVVNRLMVIESISHEFAADPGYWHTTFILDPYPVRA
jgi:hypothetical protein